MIWAVIQAFVLGFAIDLFYCLWFYATAANRYILGVFASVSLSACTLFGFINVYDTRILAIPYLLGLALGTIVGIFLQKKFKREASERKD